MPTTPEFLHLQPESLNQSMSKLPQGHLHQVSPVSQMRASLPSTSHPRSLLGS